MSISEGGGDSMGVSAQLQENVEARACGWGYIVECQGNIVGYLGKVGCQGRLRCWSRDTVWVSPRVGRLFPVLQVFQECGGPPKAPARSRRAPAPPEEVGRLWTVGVEEERPTMASGNSLPRLVSGGQAARGHQVGGWARCSSAHSLCLSRCGSSVSGWAGSGASGPGCP